MRRKRKSTPARRAKVNRSIAASSKARNARAKAKTMKVVAALKPPERGIVIVVEDDGRLVQYRRTRAVVYA